MNFPKWNITELNGYEPKTTFWQDFCIADAFGNSAIRDTFNRAFEGWKGNYVYLTELVLVLNHKIWQWFGNDQEKATLYNELWATADEYASNNLKEEEFEYFWKWTD